MRLACWGDNFRDGEIWKLLFVIVGDDDFLKWWLRPANWGCRGLLMHGTTGRRIGKSQFLIHRLPDMTWSLLWNKRCLNCVESSSKWNIVVAVFWGFLFVVVVVWLFLRGEEKISYLNVNFPIHIVETSLKQDVLPPFLFIYVALAGAHWEK